MEVITQQQTSILYIGANQRFAEEFHRLAENVSVSVAENVVSALKWLHNNTDFENNKWVNVHKVADAILCVILNSEEDLKLLKSYIEKTFDPSKKIPFVLLGTQVSREDKLMALENGFDDFFNKTPKPKRNLSHRVLETQFRHPPFRRGAAIGFSLFVVGHPCHSIGIERKGLLHFEAGGYGLPHFQLLEIAFHVS